MPFDTPDILVVGAGVSGLTTALALARAGGRVRVMCDRDPLHTTSAVAGAVWGPYTVDDPRVLRWSLQTWRALKRLAESRPDSGVRMAFGMEAFREETGPPVWIAELGDHRSAQGDELPAGYATAWLYEVPVVEMHAYITYLVGELAGLDVPVDLRPPVHSLDELAGEAEVIVNCTGLGARDIVPDDEVYPVQGQLVVVDNPGVDGFFIDDGGPTYYIAHGDHVVLGGTSVERCDLVTPDPRVSEAIVQRCSVIEPAFAQATVREHRVGLRPARSRVRLERIERVVHNYGHGGSGVTLSWGCANDVEGLVFG